MPEVLASQESRDPSPPESDAEPLSPWVDLATFAATPRLGDLTLSHDGTTLVCSVQALDPAGTGYATSLWRIDPEGGAPARRLTRSVQGEAAAAFLRDGSLLFTSKRDVPALGETSPKESETALWCLPAEGGEAYVVARRDGGFGQVLTAADSDDVVLGVLMHEGMADDEADAAKREARRRRKVNAILHDAYPVRFWDHDIGPETLRLRTAVLAGSAEYHLTKTRDVTGDVGRSVGDAVLSRDGTTIVAQWAVPKPRGEVITQLVVIDVATGQRRVAAADDDADFSAPVISDDGTTLVCRREQLSTAEQAPKVDLWLVDLATGEGRFLARDWDRWPTPAAFSPDAATVYAVADEDGRGPVFAVDVASGDVRRLTTDGAHSSVVRSPDGARLFAVRSSWSCPGEIVSIDVTAGTSTPVPAPVTYPQVPGTLERVETRADDGTRVPGWLVLPDSASAENPAPLTLWVHGGPLHSWNAWSWRWCPWLLASRGHAVLLPDPALSTGYGQAFIQRGWGRWGAEPYTDVMALTDAVEARDDVRDDQSVMMGGSFGGYMANWIATHTDRFTAIVSHASLWNLESFGPTTDASWFWSRQLSPRMQAEHSPHLFADNITTPMLVIHGDKDYRVPIGEGLALWWSLVSRHDGDPAELPHRFLYFPDENHWVLSPQHAIIWYETVLEFAAARREGRSMSRPELL